MPDILASAAFTPRTSEVFKEQHNIAPVSIAHIGKAQAIDKDFTEVPFSTFLTCDNYFVV